MPLVKEIGTLVAFIKFDINENLHGASYKNANYLQRSFCVLELYAAVAGKVNLVINTAGYYKEILEKILAPQRDESAAPLFALGGFVGPECWVGPVNCAAAAARSGKDKAQIDGFIGGSVGFEEMDRVVTEAIFKSC